MDGRNFWLISRLEKLSQDRAVSNFAEKNMQHTVQTKSQLFEG